MVKIQQQLTFSIKAISWKKYSNLKSVYCLLGLFLFNIIHGSFYIVILSGKGLYSKNSLKKCPENYQKKTKCKKCSVCQKNIKSNKLITFCE